MNEIVKKIGELRQNISYINFKEHLSHEDYEDMRRMDIEIKTLEERLKGCKLVALKIDGYLYLTDDSNLCYCSKPTWFDNEEEALEYFEKAEITNKDNIKVEFEYKEI